MLDTMTDPKLTDYDDVEITPEMIAAGAHALLGYNLDSFKPCEVRRAVIASFVAMMKSRPQAPS